jgi:predicted metal-dependent enzyme (double-stranded beta helix superfamily)
VISPIDELLSDLAAFDSEEYQWLPAAETLLRASDITLQHVVQHLADLTADARQDLLDGSHETTTHLKWLMHRNNHPRFTVWLHTYKEECDRRFGYAEVPHDHRYDIASRILTGGYVAAEWQHEPRGGVTSVSAEKFLPGDVMFLRADQIHSLTTILPTTATLVIEGALRRHHSTAWYPDQETPKRFPDFNARWDALAATQQWSTQPDCSTIDTTNRTSGRRNES